MAKVAVPYGTFARKIDRGWNASNDVCDKGGETEGQEGDPFAELDTLGLIRELNGMLRGSEGGDDGEKYHQACVVFRLQSGETTKKNPLLFGKKCIPYEKHCTKTSLCLRSHLPQE